MSGPVNVYAPFVGTASIAQPIVFNHVPGPSDVNYNLGQFGIYPTANGAYVLTSKSTSNGTVTANWTTIATSSGDIDSITTDDSTVVTPTTGNVNLSGATNQLTTTGSGSTATVALVSAVVAPGSVTATTTLTATLGAITATNGNLVLGTAGNKVVIATGANASVGTSSAMSGSPGAVTVATTASSASAKVFYSRATTGGTPGQVSITAQDGTGFTLTSTGNETSTFNWWIINA